MTFDIGINDISISSYKIRMSAWWGSYGDGQWNIVTLGAKEMESPIRVLLTLHSQKKLRMDDQKVECSQLPFLISTPGTPAALKKMPGIQQELKEEEKLNLGLCMGQLNM